MATMFVTRAAAIADSAKADTTPYCHLIRGRLEVGYGNYEDRTDREYSTCREVVSNNWRTKGVSIRRKRLVRKVCAPPSYPT